MVDMTRGRWAFDIGLALLLVVLGLVEVWLPLASVMGEGSPIISTIGVLWFHLLHLTQRRAHPWVALAGLLVWPVLSVLNGGQVQVLFFGQLVPIMVLVFSLARHAPSPLRWIAGGCGIVLITAADLSIPVLRESTEILFHWGALTLSYVAGHMLRVSAERTAEHAVRAHTAEASARESALIAIASERARIARELHDIVAHSVGVMVVQAGAAEQVVEDDPEFARRALATICSTGSSALGEMRRLVGVLRDPDVGHDLAPQPGVAALGDLVERARESGLEVDLEVTGQRPHLPAGLDLTAYRIVQEALTNVRRHSQATRALVVMDYGPETLEICVSDHGPAAPSGGAPGHGLLGMRERASLFGGQVEAGAQGHGFQVRAVLPLERV
ncbi:MAG: sensor histidine kinase [Ornithinimicrobium sp.]|uniref:sensor histidine kinase n=1 Tax=Ornithinimicrobium sp. TaxID=1977084 RepID=UPI0026DF1D84|nr:sensor histidine kinase [Ornithinimicrobium sp.]MDO5740631.1 sensor histidine kinase [Ornithinimicrobium sp.]